MNKIPKIEYKELTSKEINNYIDEIYENFKEKVSSKRNIVFYTTSAYNFFLDSLKKESYVLIINEMNLEDYERKQLLKLVKFGNFDLVGSLMQGIKEKQKRKWIVFQSTFIIPSNKWQMIKL
jgi:hypothetical protein